MTTNTVRTAESGFNLAAEQLAPRDAVFVYDEFDRHPSNIVAAYVFADTGAARPDRVRAWMRERLGHAPLFLRRLARVPGDIDLPYWIPDPGFDLDEHVRVAERALSWPDVRDRIAEITSARMDLTRPPWELHVFPGVGDFREDSGEDSENSSGDSAEPVTLVVLKFHHSVGDGVATRELERKLFATDGTHPPVPAFGKAPSRSGAGPAATLRAVTLVPYRFARFAAGIARTRTAARTVRDRAAEGRIQEPVALRPATRFNRQTTSALTFDLVTLPMARVRAVKAMFTERVTVNDLLLTVVAGALAEYLAERDEIAPATLGAMVPISMRGITEWDSANQLCQMSVDLHTDRTDPLARLHAIRRSAQLEKQRWADPAVIARETRVQTSPAWLLRLAGWARAQRTYDGVETVPLNNTTVSNVPQSADQPEFLGARMRSVFGVLPVMDGDGLRHLITSQDDRLVIAFSADADMLPDPQHYGALLLKSFHGLCRAIEAARA